MLGACIGFIIGAIFGFSMCVAIVVSNNGEE